MAHFAELDESNTVSRVVVVNDAYEADGENWCREFFNTSAWKQTSYNTSGGVHSDNGTPLRKNYASIGYSYNPTLDAFCSPKPFDSWTLDENTCLWEAPIASPGVDYIWDEPSKTWSFYNR